jgi:hypothetical protein
VVLSERFVSLLGAGRGLRGPRSGPFGTDDGRLVDLSFEAMRESRRGVLWGVWGSLEEDIFICVNVDDGKVKGVVSGDGKIYAGECLMG